MIIVSAQKKGPVGVLMGKQKGYGYGRSKPQSKSWKADEAVTAIVSIKGVYKNRKEFIDEVLLPANIIAGIKHPEIRASFMYTWYILEGKIYDTTKL